MLILTIALLALATCCSALSRSALQWSVILVAGLICGFGIGTQGLHGYLFVADLLIFTVMVLNRQQLNHWWQECVIYLQIVISVAYIIYAVFAGGAPWLTTILIDLANVLFLAQAALVGSGGAWNGYRNLMRLKQQRKKGRNIPISTIWKMI